MTRRFPRKNLVPVGALPAERMGLSERRSLQLKLIGAWTAAAGPRLAARATPLGIRRGVLELRLSEDDETWTHTLLECLPRLAAAIASALPRPSIESVRLFAPDGTPVAPALALDAEPAPLREAVSMRDSPERRRTGEATPARLARIMRAYLERSGSSSDAD